MEGTLKYEFIQGKYWRTLMIKFDLKSEVSPREYKARVQVSKHGTAHTAFTFSNVSLTAESLALINNFNAAHDYKAYITPGKNPELVIVLSNVAPQETALVSKIIKDLDLVNSAAFSSLLEPLLKKLQN